MYHVYCVYIMFKHLIACGQTRIPFFGYFLGGVKNLALGFRGSHNFSRQKKEMPVRKTSEFSETIQGAEWVYGPIN